VALLYILSEHLKGQVERTGRTGFKLHVLYVDDGTLPSNVTAESLLGNIKLRFPEHSYTISSLSDITSPDDITALLSHNNNTLDAAPPAATEAQPTLENILSSVKSATSRADILQLLRRRFIVQFAKSHACESILWADSTTRLAERTLAETAKGRGLSLPWIVADGVSPYGIQFYFPMRELLSKEISAYASLAKPPLDDLALQDELKPVVSTKSTSIDDLMKQYFESVERDYPSIVANVVRTTGKLRTPNFSQAEMHCELCEMPLDNASPERSRLCYGCIRMLPAADVR
jgi:cytoplasmic tRNA 2-thiolation protein 2